METGAVDTEKIEQTIGTGVEALTRHGWEGALKIILTAVILLVVCLVVRNILLRILDRGLDKSRIEKSFHTFIHSAVNIICWFITIMVVAESLGINANSLLTLVGIVGLAISLSVKDSLSNLAGGLTILGTRPFKVGDYVEIGDVGGTILEIGMVHTRLNTVDNRLILVPNSTVVDAQVTNYSAETLRRVDLVVSASYDAPVEKVKETIQNVLRSHEKILLDPEPFARLSSYGDSAINYTIRVWCENADYWDVYHDVLEQIKTAFDREGISIPYPQVEVSLKRES